MEVPDIGVHLFYNGNCMLSYIIICIFYTVSINDYSTMSGHTSIITLEGLTYMLNFILYNFSSLGCGVTFFSDYVI